MPQQRSWVVVAAGGAMAATALLFAAMVSLHVPGVDGHAYLMKPHSRQYLMSRVFKEEGVARFEDCPQCYNAGGNAATRDRGIQKTDPAVLAEYGEGFYPLRWVFDKGEMAENGNYAEPEEIAVRHGVCGDPRQHQDDSWNWYGTPNENWEVDYETTQGAVIEMKVAMSAFHWGHLEFAVCDTADLDDPKGGVVTQECFNKHPLTRADGDDVNSPIDPNYPGRYYCDPECRENETDQEHDPRSDGGYIMTMNYQLPADLTCTHCVLQMTYYTGHKCHHPGYEEFNPPSWPGSCAPDKEDWVHLDVDYCGDNLWAYAEEFWGCSDFSISADGSGPTATDAPVTDETEAPLGTNEGGDKTTAGAGGDEEECADPVEAYEQCGGSDYEGSTCCHPGHECTFMVDCYYQCRPIKA